MREPRVGAVIHRSALKHSGVFAQQTELVGVTLSQLTGGLHTARLSLRSLGSVTRAFSGTISPILTAASGSQASITVSV